MKTSVHCFWRRLQSGLYFLLSFQLVLLPVSAQNLPTRLNLAVVEGEGAINNMRQKAAQDPVVRVEDENNRPVSGAAVVFTLPVSGATGEFTNGSRNLTVTTDKDGLATARGIKTNEVAGKLPIHVTASYRGLTARTIITQFNMAVPGTKRGGGGHGKVVAVLAVLGAAAAGGALAATRNSNSVKGGTPSTAAAAPIGITPGTGTITGPR